VSLRSKVLDVLWQRVTCLVPNLRINRLLLLRCMSPLLAHRDILQRRSSLSANGGIAEVEGWVGPAASVANDPKPTSHETSSY